MASGNLLFTLPALTWSPTATLSAQFDIIVGTSSPGEWVPVLAFDTTTIEYADSHGLIMPAHYSGGGLTCSVRWGAGANTGTVQWELALRELSDDADDIDTTAHTYVYTASSANTVPSAIGEIAYDPITITSGANMDSVAASDSFILRVRRNTADTCASDAYLHSIIITET